jgi:hypothetical protein
MISPARKSLLAPALDCAAKGAPACDASRRTIVNTLKSAALLAVLLGVLYGVYVALNKPELPGLPGFGGPPPVGDTAPPLIESPGAVSFPSAPAPAGSAFSRGTSDQSPASAYGERSVRGGSYPANADATSLPPPPTTVPGAPAAESTGAASSGLARSAYEEAATSPASQAASAAPTSQAPPLEMTPVSRAATEAAAAAPALAAYALRNDMTEAEQLVSAGKFKSALAKLSPHCANHDLPAEQRAALFAWLDGLAAKVIYSREHLLAAPHQVRKGETLYDVAHQYNVEYRLLQNINHKEVSDPLILVPATELKVVPGPFDVEVNLTTGEITLLVNDLYAGRFPFVVGDQPPQPGDYRVVDKRSQQKTYVGFDGRMIPANDPTNPYGGWWISLGGEAAIHGSPTQPGDKTLGCISLSPQDAKDVYGIVSIGSDVKIRR